MTTFNNDFWNDRDSQTREDELNYNRITRADSDPDDEIEDEDLDTDLADEDEDLDTDYDTEADDDLYEDDDEEDDATARNTEFVNDAGSDNLPESKDDDNEIPEQEEADKGGAEHPQETEVEQQDKGNDASFSEQTDVTPPRPHEFPSEGNARTDFASRNQGRTTGRMLGHEPGTEGI
jgi:hypothetical protein